MWRTTPDTEGNSSGFVTFTTQFDLGLVHQRFKKFTKKVENVSVKMKAIS